MLYYDHGVPQIPETFQSIQQLIVIPLVKSDTGLVQYIADPYQAGADLGSQPDTLGLTAGQSCGGP